MLLIYSSFFIVYCSFSDDQRSEIIDSGLNNSCIIWLNGHWLFPPLINLIYPVNGSIFHVVPNETLLCIFFSLIWDVKHLVSATIKFNHNSLIYNNNHWIYFWKKRRIATTKLLNNFSLFFVFSSLMDSIKNFLLKVHLFEELWSNVHV